MKKNPYKILMDKNYKNIYYKKKYDFGDFLKNPMFNILTIHCLKSSQSEIFSLYT